MSGNGDVAKAESSSRDTLRWADTAAVLQNALSTNLTGSLFSYSLNTFHYLAAFVYKGMQKKIHSQIPSEIEDLLKIRKTRTLTLSPGLLGNPERP